MCMADVLNIENLTNVIFLTRDKNFKVKMKLHTLSLNLQLHYSKWIWAVTISYFTTLLS